MKILVVFFSFFPFFPLDQISQTKLKKKLTLSLPPLTHLCVTSEACLESLVESRPTTGCLVELHTHTFPSTCREREPEAAAHRLSPLLQFQFLGGSPSQSRATSAAATVRLCCSRGRGDRLLRLLVCAHSRLMIKSVLLCLEPSVVCSDTFLSRFKAKARKKVFVTQQPPSWECLPHNSADHCRYLPPFCVFFPFPALSTVLSLYRSMVDKGPLLTSAIIFYLSIGAAIFQVLEEPNWKLAAKRYNVEKDAILKDYPCLSRDDLNRILKVWLLN